MNQYTMFFKMILTECIFNFFVCSTIIYVLRKWGPKLFLEYLQTPKRLRKIENGATSNTNNSDFVPKSVNYHFTRVCNYSCGFCFHTAKTSYMLNLEDAKIGMRMLKNAGEFLKTFHSLPELFPHSHIVFIIFFYYVQFVSVFIITNILKIMESKRKIICCYVTCVGR